MAKEWLEHIAKEIAAKDHTAAEQYKKGEHNKALIQVQGKLFYDGLLTSLANDLKELGLLLDRDLGVSEPITLNKVSNTTKITRTRFPTVNAMVNLEEGRIVMYENNMSKQTGFPFHIGEQEKISAFQAGLTPIHYFHESSELAKKVIELLFKVTT